MTYKTYQEYRDAWKNSDRIDPKVPLNVDLELASLCNLRCPMCFVPDPSFEKFISQKSSDGKPLKRIMPKEMAFKIIDQCVEIGVPALKFNWRGESTLHPDYSEIVRYAYFKKPPFFDLLANTNANCGDKSIEGLMCCTKTMVSLDSMNPDTYKIMRRGGNLQRAKQVINRLVHEGHKNLWIRRVLTVHNSDEEFDAEVKAEFGDSVKTSSHFCFDRNALVKAEQVGCDHDIQMPRKYCQYPSQRLVISSAGYVYPCCIDLHETMPMGHILKNKIVYIWNSDNMKDLRKRLRTNDESVMSRTCKDCESWMSYDAKQRNFVNDVSS